MTATGVEARQQRGKCLSTGWSQLGTIGPSSTPSACYYGPSCGTATYFAPSTVNFPLEQQALEVPSNLHNHYPQKHLKKPEIMHCIPKMTICFLEQPPSTITNRDIWRTQKLCTVDLKWPSAIYSNLHQPSPTETFGEPRNMHRVPKITTCCLEQPPSTITHRDILKNQKSCTVYLKQPSAI